MGRVGGNEVMGLLRKERSGRSFELGWRQDVVKKKKGKEKE